jgi:hypothetical protein
MIGLQFDRHTDADALIHDLDDRFCRPKDVGKLYNCDGGRHNRRQANGDYMYQVRKVVVSFMGEQADLL